MSPSNESSLELCRFVGETGRAHSWNVARMPITDPLVNIPGDGTYETSGGQDGFWVCLSALGYEDRESALVFLNLGW